MTGPAGPAAEPDEDEIEQAQGPDTDDHNAVRMTAAVAGHGMQASGARTHR